MGRLSSNIIRVIGIIQILFSGDLGAQQPELILPAGHTNLVSGIYFSPDGKIVITNGEEEKNLKVWEARTGKLLKTINEHTERITSVSFSADGRYFLTTGHDQHAYVWDTRSLNIVYKIRYNFNNWIDKGEISRDGTRILLVSDNMMEYHDVKAKKLLRPVFDSSLLTVKDRDRIDRERINSVALSPDGKRAVSTHEDSSIRVWDLVSGRIITCRKLNKGKYYGVVFSQSGNWYLACNKEGSVNIWDNRSGNQVARILKPGYFFTAASFSPDEQQIVSCTMNPAENTVVAELWDVKSEKQLRSFNMTPGLVTFSAGFHPKKNLMVTSSDDGFVRLWDASSGTLVREITGMEPRVKERMPRVPEDGYRYLKSSFSSDGNLIAATSINNVVTIQESISGKIISRLGDETSTIYEPRFSPDGNQMASAGFSGNIDVRSSLDGIVNLWDLQEGSRIRTLSGHTGPVLDIRFSEDNRHLATVSADSTARIWDLATGKTLFVFRGHEKEVHQCFFTRDAKFLVTKTFSGVARIWNLESGSLVSTIRHDSAVGTDRYGVYQLQPSVSGKFLFIRYYDDDNLIQIAETATGRKIYSFNTRKDTIGSVQIDPQERNLYYRRGDEMVVHDIRSGTITKTDFHSSGKLKKVLLNHSGNRVVTLLSDTVMIRSVPDGNILSSFLFPGKVKEKIVNDNSYTLEFTEDDRYIVFYDYYDSTVRAWDARTGELFRKVNLSGEEYYLFTRKREGRNYIFSRAMDNILRIRDMESGELMTSVLDKFTSDLVYEIHPVRPRLVLDNKFTSDILDFGHSAPTLRIIPAPGNGFLMTDSVGHYDGTEEARKSLYFTCGTEIVELDQVKDLLWVPGLTQRVMKKETIHAPGIKSLNICGLTPEVTEDQSKTGEYHFRIIPRRGGLGETVLYINGIEAKRYKPGELIKESSGYVLRVTENELKNFFIAGQENPVTVKAYTSDNGISSRGAVVTSKEEKQPATPPNLYAVMIGVSDYKGTELDLKYAAKDAADIAHATGIAARKLLNTDGKEHVFIYNLNTSTKRDQLPEKNAVKKILGEIGKKATANDLLLVFFAGHGVMVGEADKKQFYFLTADASTLASTAAVKDVGISTAELTEWMKPQNIKAQKRILIFDACNSGQAIKDFVKMGGSDQQYMAARSDDKSQLIKAIDKLNEKSGLFILSASASDQSAYEMGRYSQGLLTYSLLKAIKQEPEILENGKYLSVSRWFNAAERTVSELSKETGARQEPQIVSTTNFNIGIVDEEVMAEIVLPQEKPLFAASNFQNSDEAIADDDLELSKMINLQLGEMATRGMESKIVYMTATNSPDAWTLSGRYTVSGNAITAQVNIKQSKTIKHRFEINGTTDKLKELAALISEKAAGLVN